MKYDATATASNHQLSRCFACSDLFSKNFNYSFDLRVEFSI